MLGGVFLVTLMEIVGLMGWGSGTLWLYNRFASEMFRWVLLAVSIVAGLGGVLLVGLLALYPDLMLYLVSVFRPVFITYGILIVAFTLLIYGYYFSWNMRARRLHDWLHVSVGVLVNVVGLVLTMLGNAWSSFMLTPAGISEQGAYLGNIWHVLHTAVWNPLNVHRIASHILLAAVVFAVYGAYRAMTAESCKERQYYDWLSCVAFSCGVVALLTLPFGGYWLMREIYAFRQQMGITLLGGLLAWLGVVLVVAMGLLFFAMNYFFWQRIDAAGGTPRYGFMAKYVYLILALSMMVTVTPHTIVMTPLELQQMGGQQHPVLGNYGVESAKSSASWIMIIATIWSWVVWQRCRFPDRPLGRLKRDWLLMAAFIMGAVNILALGIYGYFIPANVRIGLQISMLGTVLSIGFLVLLLRPNPSSETHTSAQWGFMSFRGYGAMIFVAFAVTWVMGLGGYRRSSVRLFWHINEVMRDQSPWAFTHTIGFTANLISLNALFFWFGIALIFWLGRRGSKRFMSEDQDIFVRTRGDEKLHVIRLWEKE